MKLAENSFENNCTRRSMWTQLEATAGLSICPLSLRRNIFWLRLKWCTNPHEIRFNYPNVVLWLLSNKIFTEMHPMNENLLIHWLHNFQYWIIIMAKKNVSIQFQCPIAFASVKCISCFIRTQIKVMSIVIQRINATWAMKNVDHI